MPRIRAHDGASLAWTDDANLIPDGDRVLLARPGMSPAVVWVGADPAALIDALTEALDRAESYGVVDVRDLETT